MINKEGVRELLINLDKFKSAEPDEIFPRVWQEVSKKNCRANGNNISKAIDDRQVQVGRRASVG